MTWVNIGVALKQAGKLPEAEQAYLKAIELYPEYGAAHFNLALVLEAQGRQDEALEHFHLASRTCTANKAPNYARVWRIIILPDPFRAQRLPPGCTFSGSAGSRLAQVQRARGFTAPDAYPIAREASSRHPASPEYADAWLNLECWNGEKGDRSGNGILGKSDGIESRPETPVEKSVEERTVKYGNHRPDR